MTLGDLVGLYLYAVVIALGLIIGWSVMACLRRFTGISRWLVYPLGGLLTMATIMGLMSLAFPMTPIAPARHASGIAGQCLAGVIGGIVLAWLQQRSGR